MIKKFEGVRQYLFMFSMLAASTAFVFYDYDIANNQWYSLNTINFWVNHLVIVLLPLLFVASNRFKPKVSYLLPVMFSAFLYVALSGIFSWYLIEFQGVPRESTYSYVFYPEVNAVFRYLYTLIPIYFVYLIPIGVVIAMINAALILLFKRKQIDTF
ncbi:hypothetical protein [Acholeplasma equifetale]|uniref:hypothetical protein n=1 Tax=Acholeplasma equifetale TaxID=264634 RepID=UPI00316AE3F7